MLLTQSVGKKATDSAATILSSWVLEIQYKIKSIIEHKGQWP